MSEDGIAAKRPLVPGVKINNCEINLTRRPIAAAAGIVCAPQRSDVAQVETVRVPFAVPLKPQGAVSRGTPNGSQYSRARTGPCGSAPLSFYQEIST